jgi:hypothetical protein
MGLALAQRLLNQGRCVVEAFAGNFGLLWRRLQAVEGLVPEMVARPVMWAVIRVAVRVFALQMLHRTADPRVASHHIRATAWLVPRPSAHRPRHIRRRFVPNSASRRATRCRAALRQCGITYRRG